MRRNPELFAKTRRHEGGGKNGRSAVSMQNAGAGHTELFFLDAAPGPGENAVFAGGEAHHISRVKRHRTGDRISATDGKGAEYELELIEVKPNRVTGRVVAIRHRPREARCRFVLAQAIIKGDHMCAVVEGVTQLGAAEVIPLRTKRVVAGLSKTRFARLRAVAKEAAKCSGRTVLPDIGEPVGLAGLAARAGEFDAALVADEEEESMPLDEALDRGAQSVLLVVGPEGGFEREEIRQMEAAGIRRFTMGPRRFRAETAATVAAALVLYRLGDMGGQRQKEGFPGFRVRGAEGQEHGAQEPLNPRTFSSERRC